MRGRIGCALAGYGETFGWGRIHGRWIRAVETLELRAICTRSERSAERARADHPGVRTFTDLDTLLARDDIHLVTILTPPHTHAAIAQRCLGAGKHVLVEKPMAITTAECTAMIDAARRAGRTLAVFCNRRHDGNIRAITKLIREGAIGEVLHAEFFVGDATGRGATGWRALRSASGGEIYDWGGHVIDWLHQWIPGRVTTVLGFTHPPRAMGDTNESHTHLTLGFEGGASASVTVTHHAHIGKPQWLILGTRGTLLDTAAGALEGYTRDLVGNPTGTLRLCTAEGERVVPYETSDWVTYYRDLASHLLEGGPVPVTAEEGRRVVAVLEAGYRSAREGGSRTVAHE